MADRDDIAQEMMAQADPWAGRFGPQGWPGSETTSSSQGGDSQFGPWIDALQSGPPSNYVTDMRDAPYDPQLDVWPLPNNYGFDQTYTPYFDDLTGLSAEMGNRDIYNQTQQNIYDRAIEGQPLQSPTQGGAQDLDFQLPNPPLDLKDIPLQLPNVPDYQGPPIQVDPVQQGFFEGVNPYDNAGASGIPGSYGAPGMYGHRRENL